MLASIRPRENYTPLFIKDNYIIVYDGEQYNTRLQGQYIPPFNGNKDEYESQKTKVISKYREDYRYFLTKSDLYTIVYFFNKLIERATKLVKSRYPNRVRPNTDIS